MAKYSVGDFVSETVQKDKGEGLFELENDYTLEAGRQIQVEAAEDGIDVSLNRYVIQDGQTISTDRVYSHYRPSHNVTATGTLR